MPCLGVQGQVFVGVNCVVKLPHIVIVKVAKTLLIEITHIFATSEF